jgi:hypothetical protein
MGEAPTTAVAVPTTRVVVAAPTTKVPRRSPARRTREVQRSQSAARRRRGVRQSQSAVRRSHGGSRHGNRHRGSRRPRHVAPRLAMTPRQRPGLSRIVRRGREGTWRSSFSWIAFYTGCGRRTGTTGLRSTRAASVADRRNTGCARAVTCGPGRARAGSKRLPIDKLPRPRAPSFGQTPAPFRLNLSLPIESEPVMSLACNGTKSTSHRARSMAA